MLMALIPGVREVRAPLVAGALWFTSIWLIVARNPDAFSQGVDTRALQSLADFVGRPGIVGAATAASFVLGSLNNSLIQRVVDRRVLSLHKAHPEPATTVYDNYPNRLFRAMSSASKGRVFERGYRSALQAAGVSDATTPISSQLHEKATAIGHQVVHETYFVSPRLIIAKPEMWAQYDRMVSESDLREGASLPTLVLGIVLSNVVNWPIGARLGIVALAVGLAGLFFVESRTLDRLALGMVAHTVGEGVIGTTALDYLVERPPIGVDVSDPAAELMSEGQGVPAAPFIRQYDGDGDTATS